MLEQQKSHLLKEINRYLGLLSDCYQFSQVRAIFRYIFLLRDQIEKTNQGKEFEELAEKAWIILNVRDFLFQISDNDIPKNEYGYNKLKVSLFSSDIFADLPAIREKYANDPEWDDEIVDYEISKFDDHYSIKFIDYADYQGSILFYPETWEIVYEGDNEQFEGKLSNENTEHILKCYFRILNSLNGKGFLDSDRLQDYYHNDAIFKYGFTVYCEEYASEIYEFADYIAQNFDEQNEIVRTYANILNQFANFLSNYKTWHPDPYRIQGGIYQLFTAIQEVVKGQRYFKKQLKRCENVYDLFAYFINFEILSELKLFNFKEMAPFIKFIGELMVKIDLFQSVYSNLRLISPEQMTKELENYCANLYLDQELEDLRNFANAFEAFAADTIFPFVSDSEDGDIVRRVFIQNGAFLTRMLELYPMLDIPKKILELDAQFDYDSEFFSSYKFTIDPNEMPGAAFPETMDFTQLEHASSALQELLNKAKRPLFLISFYHGFIDNLD